MRKYEWWWLQLWGAGSNIQSFAAVRNTNSSYIKITHTHVTEALLYKTRRTILWNIFTHESNWKRNINECTPKLVNIQRSWCQDRGMGMHTAILIEDMLIFCLRYLPISSFEGLYSTDAGSQLLLLAAGHNILIQNIWRVSPVNSQLPRPLYCSKFSFKSGLSDMLRLHNILPIKITRKVD